MRKTALATTGLTAGKARLAEKGGLVETDGLATPGLAQGVAQEGHHHAGDTLVETDAGLTAVKTVVGPVADPGVPQEGALLTDPVVGPVLPVEHPADTGAPSALPGPVDTGAPSALDTLATDGGPTNNGFDYARTIGTRIGAGPGLSQVGYHQVAGAGVVGGPGPGVPQPAITRLPRVGEIVLLRGHAVGTPDPAGALGADKPGIVTFVHVDPAVVDLTVFASDAPPRQCGGVEYGCGVGHWYWPEPDAALRSISNYPGI